MSEPEKKSRFSEWLSPQFVVTMLSLIVAFTLAWANIKSDIRNQDTRVSKLEEDVKGIASMVALNERQRIGDRELLIEIRADVKNLKEKFEVQGSKS